MDADLLDADVRLARLLESPDQIQILAPLSAAITKNFSAHHRSATLQNFVVICNFK